MNRILKLWTSILTNIGSPLAKAQGILSDTSDGFRRHRKIHDNLSTHTIFKLKKHICTAYSDFKGAFGGMNHRTLFKATRELRFPECYTNHMNNSIRYQAPTT